MALDKAIIIPIRLKRTVKGVMLQHLIAGVALLATIWEFLGEHDNPHRLFLIIEAIIAICLVVAILNELRHVRKGYFPQSHFVNILAAGVIACEGTNKLLEGRLRLAIAWWLAALITLVVSLIRPRLKGKNYFKIASSGITVKYRPFGKVFVSWDQIEKIEKQPHAIRIWLKDNTTREFESILNLNHVADEFYTAIISLGFPAASTSGFGNSAASISEIDDSTEPEQSPGELKGINTLSFAAFVVLVGILVTLIFRHSLFAQSWPGIAIQILAFMLMIWARLTLKLRSFHATANPTGGGIITSGPYKYIRHPIYAAVFYFLWAGAFYHISVINICLMVVASVMIGLRIYSEEKLLATRYPEYAGYAARTKRIMPFVA